MLIKSLINIDSFDDSQAISLRAISSFISAYPLVVSVKTNREFLNDRVIYSRFQLPVVTPELFKNLIDEDSVPVVESSKGRNTISIDTNLLREKRKQMSMSLQKLSEVIGISKKALYEIEKNRVNPTEDTVNRLEAFLKIDLKTPYSLRIPGKTYLKPRNEFQKKVSDEFSRMGIDNSSVYSAPFEIIGKEEFSLITGLSKNKAMMKRDVKEIKMLSSVFSSKAVFILKKKPGEETIEGIPIVLESDLPEIESSKEFTKIMQEKSGV